LTLRCSPSEKHVEATLVTRLNIKVEQSTAISKNYRGRLFPDWRTVELVQTPAWGSFKLKGADLLRWHLPLEPRYSRSILDRDRPERKARFERWLSPENFDERTQLTSLGALAAS
jgi:hypothetical protein